MSAAAARNAAFGASVAVVVVAVAVAAIAARALLAALLPFPIPEDTAYYVGVAANVLDGRGLVSDALWTYATPPLVLPRPAFEIWLPLPTLAALAPMAVLGPTFRAAQLVPIAAGVLVAVLASLLAGDLARERGRDVRQVRTLMLGTGLTAAVYLPLLLHSALPDSTMLFGALVLLAGRLMASDRPPTTGSLVRLGLLIGVAALVRNEAIWLGTAWLLVVILDARRDEVTLIARLRLVAIPATVAAIVLVPWWIRQALAFGTPFPAQAALNALSVRGEDIFAWSDPPTLERFLAQGPAWLLTSRIEGLRHDLVDVLVAPGFPIALLGLAALATPIARSRLLRPLLLYGAVTFAVTSLVFPVSTTWGTFLHAATPIHVLLLVGATALLDDGFAALARLRRWHRPTAWLGQALALAVAATMSLTLATFVAQSRDWDVRYEALVDALPAAGVAVGDGAPPVITDFPIWYATAVGAPALALPDEDPASVVALARRFGARHVLMMGDDHGRWPAVIEGTGADGIDGARCFRRVHIASRDGWQPRLWLIECD